MRPVLVEFNLASSWTLPVARSINRKHRKKNSTNDSPIWNSSYNLGQKKWNIWTTPPPISMMPKWRVHCWRGMRIIVPFYTVQDCSYSHPILNRIPQATARKTSVFFLFRAGSKQASQLEAADCNPKLNVVNRDDLKFTSAMFLL